MEKVATYEVYADGERIAERLTLEEATEVLEKLCGKRIELRREKR